MFIVAILCTVYSLYVEVRVAAYKGCLAEMKVIFLIGLASVYRRHNVYYSGVS